ncbi:hypothetical protein F4212_12355 [Candidatus Poribacteria bacterium]|nr:hypothetical protein [Candidatus Poribacteria bacterium]
MSSCKLSPVLIEQLISKLNERASTRQDLLALGIRARGFCVRRLCADVGISHTTFYRWLTAYRLLGDKKHLLANEKLLRRLGEAFDAAQNALAVDRTRVSSNLLPTINYNVGRKGGDTAQQQSEKEQSSDTDILAVEARTDELTSGIGYVTFAVKDSLKNM